MTNSAKMLIQGKSRRDDFALGLRMFTRPNRLQVTFFYPPIENGIEVSDVIHGARDAITCVIVKTELMEKPSSMNWVGFLI
jgi:hypothetical protein